jgi:hypothetical protein
MLNPKTPFASAFRKATSAAFIHVTGEEIEILTPEYLRPTDARGGITIPRRMPT